MDTTASGNEMTRSFWRYVTGYALGGTVFLALIPAAFYGVTLAFGGRDAIPVHPVLRLAVALALLVVGLFFMAWSNLFLFFVGKGGPTDVFDKAITPRTKRLVVTGPYRWSRNPMVFGAFACYAAEVIALNSYGGMAVLLCFFAGVTVYLRRVEEPRLLRDFGLEYELYRKTVPMIVPYSWK